MVLSLQVENKKLVRWSRQSRQTDSPNVLNEEVVIVKVLWTL